MNAAMRVLSVISAYPPSTGGAQLHAHELNRALVADGHDVAVATLWRSSRSDWLRGTSVASPSPAPPDRLDDVPVHTLGLTGVRRIATAPAAMSFYLAPQLAGRRLTASFRAQAEEVVRSVRPDVAHLSRIGREWFYEAFLEVLDEHGIPFVLTPNHHPHWGGRRRDRWWNRIYRRAAAVLVLTDEEGRAVAELGVPRERILRTVIGVVGEPHGNGGPDPARSTVLFLAQVKPFKGLALTYEAMHTVWQRHPSARFVVVGPWISESAALRRRLEGDRRVEVLGAVSDGEKWHQLRTCALLCVPSSEEALGGVYLEAWHVGRPAIGADIPPVRELFERTGGGLLVEREASAIADATLRLLDDVPFADRLGQAGRRAVLDEYTWESAAARAHVAYELATRGRTP